ncbi:CorA family divalent cation transporter [Actinoplanes subglobosus]|uniref:CorA family divalent cation transporter n=1 Tax=Actinoplanes subglobosus TaxID=1547892 RepID=A0ABV8IWC4_9ACTN
MAALVTTVAGVYGRNFAHMPELHWRYGCPSVALFMVMSVAALHWSLRRAGWW